MYRSFICSVLAVSLFWGHAETPAKAQEPRAMNAVEFVEIPRISAPRLSPDGTTLAYLRSHTDWDANEVIRCLELTDVATGEARPTPDISETAQQIWWHPNSSGFVYLKPPSPGEKVQAFFYDLALENSRQLTDHGEAVESLIWHPDGTGFFFIAAQAQPKSDRQLLDTGWIIPPYGANANREVVWFDLASGKTQIEVTGQFSVRDVSLSRDGSTLSAILLPDHALDSRSQGDVFVRNLGGAETERWTRNQIQEVSPQLSPDGSTLAYIAAANGALDPYYESKVFIQPRGKSPQRLLGDMAMEALAFAWDRTGEGVFIIGNTGVRANLYHYQLSTRQLRQLSRGDHSVIDWHYDATKDTHIARFESAIDPGEVQIMRGEDEGFSKVTSVYSEWPNRFRLPEQTAFSWRGRGGRTLEGVLVYPLDYDPDQAYPLVTITHGGPRTSSRFGSWNTSRYLPVLAAQGYMIFLPNHRGGTGYGDRFVRDMVGRYFRNAHHDVMDGIDALIEQGLADEDQLIKMGWSAGGHMVNKLITHTDRFAAASSGAGASEWLSMHGESDIRQTRNEIFGGTPWDRNAPRRRYRSDSPLAQAWKVSTPTLFFVGEHDVRVPPTQSILMHRGVRATGTPTFLFQAEDEPHNFRKPANQLFKINTELSWYARFARGERYEPVLPDAAYRVEQDEDAVEAQESFGSP